jgi:hypothetical protein
MGAIIKAIINVDWVWLVFYPEGELTLFAFMFQFDLEFYLAL